MLNNIAKDYRDASFSQQAFASLYRATLTDNFVRAARLSVNAFDHVLVDLWGGAVKCRDGRLGKDICITADTYAGPFGTISGIIRGYGAFCIQRGVAKLVDVVLAEEYATKINSSWRRIDFVDICLWSGDVSMTIDGRGASRENVMHCGRPLFFK